MVHRINEHRVIFRKNNNTDEIIAIFPFIRSGKENLAFSISKGEYFLNYNKVKDQYSVANSKDYNKTYMRMISDGYYELEIMIKTKKFKSKK